MAIGEQASHGVLLELEMHMAAKLPTGTAMGSAHVQSAKHKFQTNRVLYSYMVPYISDGGGLAAMQEYDYSLLKFVRMNDGAVVTFSADSITRRKVEIAACCFRKLTVCPGQSQCEEATRLREAVSRARKRRLDGESAEAAVSMIMGDHRCSRWKKGWCKHTASHGIMDAPWHARGVARDPVRAAPRV